MTVKDLVEAFISSRAVVMRPKTLEYYEYALGLLTSAVGGCLVSEVKPVHLEAALTGLRAGRSDATIRTIHTAWRAVFNFAVRRGLVASSPMAEVARPRRPAKVPDTYSDAEIRALLAAARTLRDRTLVLLLLDTGLRASEACGLDAGDVDFGEGWVLVRGGKGGKDRWVPMGNGTAGELRSYLGERTGLVFMGKGGKRLARFGLRSVLARLKERAGLQCRVYAHKFRHTFARRYLEAGGDLQSLSEILGHADITTTSRYYACFLRDGLKAKHRRCSPVDRGNFNQGTLF